MLRLTLVPTVVHSNTRAKVMAQVVGTGVNEVRDPVVRLPVVTHVIARTSTSTSEQEVKAGVVGATVMADTTSIEVDNGTNPLAGQVREGVGGRETVTGAIHSEISVGTQEEDTETKK